MINSHKFYYDEEGNKKVDIRIWDSNRFITEVKKSDSAKFKFFAAVRDGVRYIVIHEYKRSYGKRRDQNSDDTEWKRSFNQISIPLYMPVNKGKDIVKVFIDFLKAFQEVAEAHKDVPLEDPETMVIKTKIVYTEKELRERKENKDEQSSTN